VSPTPVLACPEANWIGFLIVSGVRTQRDSAQ